MTRCVYEVRNGHVLRSTEREVAGHTFMQVDQILTKADSIPVIEAIESAFSQRGEFPDSGSSPRTCCDHPRPPETHRPTGFKHTTTLSERIKRILRRL